MSTKKNKLYEGSIEEDFAKNVADVRATLAECLIEGDLEGFQDVFALFMETVNKKQLAKATNKSRNTFHRIQNKENLTIKTAFEILDAAG